MDGHAEKKTQDKLIVSLYEVLADESHDLGTDPGLVKDGVEAHLQQLLAEQIENSSATGTRSSAAST